jgi:hypothetical protein
MPLDFVTVATYPQGVAAHAARNFLEEHGVRAFVADEFTALNSWSNLVDVKVQVAAADSQRARKLLADWNAGEHPIDDAGEEAP